MRQASLSARWACLAGLLLACGQTDVTTYVRPNPPVDARDGSLWRTFTDAAWVFSEDTIRTYELELSDADWTYLRAHALDEEYQPATLRVDGIEVGLVGLRYKGSFGTLNRCARGGRLLCNKLSMKLRFDEYEPAQRFFGLKRLNFNSMLSDVSHLRERLAYKLFREMGVVAPRAVHAKLAVNGELLGVFSLVEDIDGRFTDDRFEAGDGNLYKERWPNTSDPAALTAALHTNEESPNHAAMIQFHEELAGARPEQLHDVVSRYMDVENLYAYVAVDRAISNYDGMLAFYCRSRCNNHNFFIYQHEAQARFTLIPWDLDNTFRVSNAFDYVPAPFVIPADCSQRFHVFGDLSVPAPACDPLLQGLARGDLSRYRAIQARLFEGPLELSALWTWFDERIAQLTPSVTADSHGPGLTAFLTGVEVLRHEAALLAERVRIESQGEQVTRSRLAASGSNDFESATAVGVRFGLSARHTLGTRFNIGISRTNALEGAQSLSLRFEFRPEKDPPWVRFVLPFDNPEPTDLNGVSRLRLVLESDAPRAIRIGIGSSGYSEYLPREVLGWDIAADGSRQQLDLPFSAAYVPEGAPVARDALADVLRYAAEVLIDPSPVGSPGTRERGEIRVDQIEFVH